MSCDDGLQLWSRKEVERIVRQIRQRWPDVLIILRGDSGFCADELLTWCEEKRVDYVVGVARNQRLEGLIEGPLAEAKQQFEATQQPARNFVEFEHKTLKDAWNKDRGPGSIMFNLRIGKVFTFGPKGEGSIAAGGGNRGSGGVFTSGQTSSTVSTGHRYTLSISMAIRNLLNHTNPGPITGNITSPLFGLANQSAGATSLGGTNFLESANNRRLELQTRFTF